MEEILIDLDLHKQMHTTDGFTELHVQLQVPAGAIIALYGKSGAGKTTLLRMIAGLTRPDSGFLTVDAVPWFSSEDKINKKVAERNIGFVFQEYALFPHMSVLDHLKYAQAQPGNAYVHELLEIFHLTALSDKKPGALSGGQKQRLAVARALARKPQLLLLDEPLSALDWETRRTLQDEIKTAHLNSGAITILVSHDADEIQRLADFVYIIDQGKILKKGKPEIVQGDTLELSECILETEIVSFRSASVGVRINESVIYISEPDPQRFRIGERVFVTPVKGGFIFYSNN
ncbi:MAG: ATP-binding cassette domain-containing protein [Ignavibacteria bacterium]|nr:ATP-binding cassette domain-containing protein [Ignavibacteria bacterium]